MTNSSRSSAPKGACLLAALVLLSGCGCSSDGIESMDAKTAATAAETAFADGDFTTAVLCCQQSLKQDASQCDMQILLARAALQTKDVETAERAAADAMALRPSDLAVAQINAQVAFARDDLEKAYIVYDKLARDESLKPESRSIGLTGRGVVAIKRINGSKGNNDAASSGDAARLDLMRALTLDRKNASAYYHLGYLYQNTYGFKKAAADQYEMYIGLMGESTDPHVEKAKAALATLQGEIAQEKERLFGTKSGNAGACSVALRRGNAALKTGGGLTKAIDNYVAALKADPSCLEALIKLAECYEKQGTAASRKSAYDCYRRAAVLRSGTSEHLMNAGRLAELRRSYQSAATQYSMALALNARDEKALEGLIRSLKMCNNKTSAKAYQRFLDSLPKKKR